MIPRDTHGSRDVASRYQHPIPRLQEASEEDIAWHAMDGDQAEQSLENPTKNQDDSPKTLSIITGFQVAANDTAITSRCESVHFKGKEVRNIQ
jgi:hypothetical protein